MELSQEELLALEEQGRIYAFVQNIDINHFLNSFKSTSFSARIRKELLQDVKVNLLYSDMISCLRSSKDATRLREYLNALFITISFTSEEIDDLKNLLKEFCLDTICSIPTEEFISQSYYDFETDSVIDESRKMFESWIWNGTSWVAPVPYPNDGKNYIWNEKTKKWKKV